MRCWMPMFGFAVVVGLTGCGEPAVSATAPAAPPETPPVPKARRRDPDEASTPGGQALKRFHTAILDEAFDDARAALDDYVRLTEDQPDALRILGLFLEAEKARHAFHTAGEGLPGFLAEPPRWLGPFIEAHRHVAAGELEQAAVLLGRARVPDVPVRVNGAEVHTHIRDLDDRLAPVLEAFAGPNYIWIPWAQVRSLQLEPISNPFHSVWRGVSVTLADGSAHRVVVPTLYVGSATHSAQARDGRLTATEALGAAPVGGSALRRAYGQRDVKLSGNTLMGILRIDRIDRIDLQHAGPAAEA